LLFVERTIDFDRHPRAHDGEIGDVAADRMLPAHCNAFVAQCA
jgi:hypothetical protein